jgi:dipeptidyl aminopeptidase/acylaminoacyl peptidase
VKSVTPPAAPPLKGVRSKAPGDLSPDKKQEAFIRDWNLWVRNVASGEERQLTTDGVTDFGYATDNAGWQHSDSPVLLWSADSTKIATFQQDMRKDGMMYTIQVTNRHPELTAWRYPFLGDADVTMISPVVIDLPTGTVTRLKMDPEFHRGTVCDDVRCDGETSWGDVEFAPDGKTLMIATSSRDHKDVWLRIADTSTGNVRTVYHEHVPTYFESEVAAVGRPNWRYLPESNEFLWFSQRSNWGQMYLYDAASGKLKNQITHGEGTVTQVLYADSKHRVLYFEATGKEPGHDPYYQHYYRVNFDGTGQQLLTPENANHTITPSPDGSTFVDAFSTVETPQVAVLRDNSGKQLVELTREDANALMAAGYKPPQEIIVKARDGKTPLYGYMWKPFDFDPAKKYPVIDYVYPGPFTGSCHSRNFLPAYGDNQSLAELGFVVVCIDGMGTPWRSKSFQDAYADSPAGLAEDTIPDQISGIKDLAAHNSFIDVDRVGVWGHSGGGNATVSAMFRYAPFFKVGIAESGNHDNRSYEADWDEKYGGLEVISKDGKSNYDVQANQDYAKGLQGHLLLAHGTADDNVPDNETLIVVDALIKANKDFDLIMIPNAHHGYGADSQYMMRRRWDYFVRNLAGATPPHEYQVKSLEEIYKAMAANGPSDASWQLDQ